MQYPEPQTALDASQAARSLPWSPWFACPGRQSFHRWSLAPSPPSWGTPGGPPCWAGSCAACSCHSAAPRDSLGSPEAKGGVRIFHAVFYNSFLVQKKVSFSTHNLSELNKWYTYIIYVNVFVHVHNKFSFWMHLTATVTMFVYLF